MIEQAAPTLFADGKEPDALRTIGEVATAFGIRQHVLRYWEQQFPMLKPLKRSGGRRYYRPEDVALVGTIDQLVNRQGYTLKGACQAIENGAALHPAPASRNSASPHPHAGSAAAEQGSELLPQLRSIRDRLAAALAA